MTTNDVLRSIRYSFNISDSKMKALFASGNQDVNKEQILGWLKREEDAGFTKLPNVYLAVFLNSLITDRRGKKEGAAPKPERHLSNNIIFRKLRIALDLKSDDILLMLDKADFKISKPELSAFFRKPEHKHYRKCNDQILRYFLKGIQLKLRPDAAAKSDTAAKSDFKWK